MKNGVVQDVLNKHSNREKSRSNGRNGAAKVMKKSQRLGEEYEE
jgi:hypothetical protein